MKKIVHKKQVFDITGKEIFPGNVIAISRKKSLKLKLCLVSSITDKSVMVFSYTSGLFKTKKISTKIKLIDNKEAFQSEIVKIENPLWMLQNKHMQEILEFSSYAKDQKMFDDNYTLGQDIQNE